MDSLRRAACTASSDSGGLEKAPHSTGEARAVAEDPTGRVWTTDSKPASGEATPPNAIPCSKLWAGASSSIAAAISGSPRLGRDCGWCETASTATPHRPCRRATAQTGLVSDESSRVFEDCDGNIWVGSIQGLNRLTPHKSTSIVDIGVVRARTRWRRRNRVGRHDERTGRTDGRHSSLEWPPSHGLRNDGPGAAHGRGRDRMGGDRCGALHNRQRPPRAGRGRRSPAPPSHVDHFRPPRRPVGV